MKLISAWNYTAWKISHVAYAYLYFFKKHNKFYQNTVILLKNSCSELENTGHCYIWIQAISALYGENPTVLSPLKPQSISIKKRYSWISQFYSNSKKFYLLSEVRLPPPPYFCNFNLWTLGRHKLSTSLKKKNLWLTSHRIAGIKIAPQREPISFHECIRILLWITKKN